MLNLIDKLVFVVPTETMTGQVKHAIESMPDKSLLQLRKYVSAYAIDPCFKDRNLWRS